MVVSPLVVCVLCCGGDVCKVRKKCSRFFFFFFCWREVKAYLFSSPLLRPPSFPYHWREEALLMLEGKKKKSRHAGTHIVGRNKKKPWKDTAVECTAEALQKFRAGCWEASSRRGLVRRRAAEHTERRKGFCADAVSEDFCSTAFAPPAIKKKKNVVPGRGFFNLLSETVFESVASEDKKCGASSSPLSSYLECSPHKGGKERRKEYGVNECLFPMLPSITLRLIFLSLLLFPPQVH